ncbi:MAG: F0F1 ATP synthase subunit B [Rhodospirillaceae bacterium]|nr:F0F1 ATP synthase subunit B [Rhodospirillaceae bacterium]|tara:strand:- start:26 stop:511 length:486 start_codon:yes stop_codon:yes gene_type:complete
MTITPELSVAIAFIIFIVLAIWKGTRKITEGLDKRAEGIRRQLDETQNLREEAQAALASYQRQQRDALAEAEQIIAQAEAEAERLKEHAEEVLTATIRRREEQAVQRIAQAEANAVQDVRNQAVELAIGVATKLIAENMTDKVQGELISNATNDVIKKLQH